jgi:hypothetical protein
MNTPPETSGKMEPVKWREQHEKILKNWSEIGASYRFLHDRAMNKFYKQNLGFTLPVIVISTITGTASFSLSSMPAGWQPYAPSVIGGFNLVAGLISTVSQFLRVSELLEGHRAASISFSKFSRTIAVELSLPIDERDSSGQEFILKMRTELDRLLEQSPNIPLEIVQSFGKKFKNTAFTKPEILEIRAVEIFKDSLKVKEDQEKRDAAAKKEAREEAKKQIEETNKLVEDAKQAAFEEAKKVLKNAEDNSVKLSDIGVNLSNNMSQFFSTTAAIAPAYDDEVLDPFTDTATGDEEIV